MLYSAERIVCAHTDEHSDRLLAYSEPTPEAVGDLAAFVEAGSPAHKVIFMGSEEDVDVGRGATERVGEGVQGSMPCCAAAAAVMGEEG